MTSVRHGPCHEQDPHHWWDALTVASRQAPANVDTRAVRELAVAGTSGTVLLADQDGEHVTTGLISAGEPPARQAHAG